ncbi:MAG: GntR family transcriptional regulator [Acidobacteriota bacterium]|nr:GntR family transcriptional regulator [Acidobacteriota bacterium]
MKEKIRNRRNLSEDVYEAIKRRLGDKDLRPGAKIKEERLAEELGVSRTPVREAIHKLEREGLVEIIPRYGTFVANLSPKDVEEIYDLRGALERLAVRLSLLKPGKEKFHEKLLEISESHHKCKSYIEKGNFEPFIKADIAFHNFLIRSSQNSRLIQVMDNLNAQVQLGRMESISVPGRAERGLKEHEEIINAMLGEDVNKAEKLIRKHCINIKKNVLHFLKTRHKRK